MKNKTSAIKKCNQNEYVCTICPRNCMVNRKINKGFCNEFNKIRIAKIINNFKWEEPCITGQKGALAIFFSGCNLRCDYCQNYDISRGNVGKEYTVQDFKKLIISNQENNDFIDLITPTHFSTQLEKVFLNFKPKIPIIWNTNSYEKIENIKKVSSFVDIFLADYKYSDEKLGEKFSHCTDYPEIAIKSIKQMCQLKPEIVESGLMKQGVIIRHLVLPGLIDNSINALKDIKKNFPASMISLMSQFTPNGKSELNRIITPLEYKIVVSYLKRLGLNYGYLQDYSSANSNFVPKF